MDFFFFSFFFIFFIRVHVYTRANVNVFLYMIYKNRYSFTAEHFKYQFSITDTAARNDTYSSRNQSLAKRS